MIRMYPQQCSWKKNIEIDVPLLTTAGASYVAEGPAYVTCASNRGDETLMLSYV